MRDLLLARNMFGPLQADLRERLQAVTGSPTEETWDKAYTIIINDSAWTTLWQAVCAVDPTFPCRGPCSDAKGRRISGWTQIPDAATIREALAYATH